MTSRSREWIQINAGLARHGGSALPAARALFRALDAALPEWRRRRLVSHCFFQRKPPDLRLRFRGLRDALMAEIDPLLDGLTVEGHLQGRFVSTYEPEARQFGGTACMAHVHTFWSRDTAIWITLDRLGEAGEARLGHAELMTAVLNELFWTTLGDGGEVWDTWCNLLTLLGSEAGPTRPAPPPAFLDTLSASAGAEEAVVLGRYRKANTRLAAGLRNAWEQGRMTCGVRTILPHVAMFTLNRHGFDQDAATALASDMAAAWNPKVHLRGAAVGLPEKRCPTCATTVRRPWLAEAG